MNTSANNSPTQFFYTVTPERILETVEITGVRCTGKIMALNSLENRVYCVELELPSSAKPKSIYDAYRVIKFYRPGRWSKEQIQEEHQFIADLQAEDLNVVSPLMFPAGETIHTIENFDDAGNNLHCAIYERIGGRLLDELNDTQVEIIGRLIARMHLVARRKTAPNRLSLNAKTFGLDNLNYLEENNLLPKEISQRYLTLAKEICSITENWFENVPVQRLHGDLHHGNILWINESLHLLDFDDFLSGPAIQDLWLLISGRDDWQKKQRDLLISAYDEITHFDFETLRLIEPLRALRQMHFSTWIARRWQDPAFQHAFPNFGTAGYWREQLNSLEEIYQMMQCGEVF